MKPGQQRTSDIADRQNMDSFLRFLRFFCQNSLKIRMQAVDCAHHVLNDRGFDCLVKLTIFLCRLHLQLPAAQPGNILCLLEQQQRRVYLKRISSGSRLALE